MSFYTYKVQSIRKVDSISYNAVGVSSGLTLYPTLAAPYNLQVKDSLGMLLYRCFIQKRMSKAFW